MLVNNAGGQFLSPAEAISPKGFRTVIELNVQGTWQMTHAAATKAFIPQRSGKVISVTLSPHHGMPGMAHSGAARAAVENMMRTLSIEWARFNVKLCAVAAGQFDTEVLRTKYPKEVAENVVRTVPLQRLGTPEEMAWLIAYLASPGGDFLSGLRDHDRRRPRQLVRLLAAARGRRRVRGAARRGAQAPRMRPALATAVGLSLVAIASCGDGGSPETAGTTPAGAAAKRLTAAEQALVTRSDRTVAALLRAASRSR